MVILAFGAPDQTGTCRLTFPRKMPIEEQRQLFNAFKTSEEINQRVDALFSSLKSSFYIKGPIENMNLKSISEILTGAAELKWCDRSEAIPNALLEASLEDLSEKKQEEAEDLWAQRAEEALWRNRAYRKAVRKTGLVIGIYS